MAEQFDTQMVEDLLCPACGHHTRRQWLQEPYDQQPVRTYTDCTNNHCRAYYITLEVDHWMAHYGEPALDDLAFLTWQARLHRIYDQAKTMLIEVLEDL